MSSEGPTRKWVHAAIDEDVFTALMRYATLQGAHTSDVIEKWIIESLTRQIDENDPELKLFMFMEIGRNRDRKINNIRNATWNAVRSQDEDKLDALRVLCEENKLSFDTIIDSIDDKTEEPVTYDNPKGINAATAFLQESTLKEQEYKVSSLQVLTNERGFSESVINAAKRNLKFKSIHRSDGWYWIRN